MGSLTCGEGGNLSTRVLGFIYVSSAGRVGCEFLHPAQPTDALQAEEALGPISRFRPLRKLNWPCSHNGNDQITIYNDYR
jgi:hypothetical protein